MKPTLVFLALILSADFLAAENNTVQSPMTMEQLMRELRIQGGNFQFSFDKPTYARVTVTTTDFPAGPQKTQFFDTASAQQKIDLFFTASALFVGEYPKGDSNDNSRKMLIKLSDCEATDGTRVINYEDKFAQNRYHGDGLNMWSPDVATHPVMNKEYILHWYFRKGDPYEAKATISFSETPFQKQ
jgi:hypothetical protein